MLQEDSNGESTFEIIDKKASELSISGDKTESLSGVSSPYSLPSPGGLVTSPAGGNLLSNVAPPPTDFTIWSSQTQDASTIGPKNIPAAQLPPTTRSASVGVGKTSLVGSQPLPPVQQYPTTQFSAAIPPSKGVQHGPVAQVSTDAAQTNSGGFIGWMKDAVSTGGILHKVAEKAKSSVDTIITTLDPQMTEFIYSGGDTEITVVSQNEEEIHLVREAFYMIFGKTWINGIRTNISEKNGMAIGFDQAVEYAEEKMSASLQLRKTPTVVIQDLLLEYKQSYYDLSLIILRDNKHNINLQTFTQSTPVPVDAFLKRAEKEVSDFAKYNSNTDKALAAYLQVCKPGWHELITGVSKRDMVHLAVRALVQMYKNHLDVAQ